MRLNAVSKIMAKEPLFEGVLGYEDTVMPQLENAILAILRGLYLSSAPEQLNIIYLAHLHPDINSRIFRLRAPWIILYKYVWGIYMEFTVVTDMIKHK